MGQQVTLDIGAVGRIEGDLDVRVVLEDGVVVEAWTEAAMFRGFELILKGKDPQAGLIVTPRICGICGGSHLYKSVYALDTAWKTHVPPNGTLIRNIAQASETIQSIPRWFYALFAIDCVNKAFAKSKFYDEVVRRFSPFVGTSYEPAVQTSAKPVEIYALFGGQWPHSSFMIPGGVMCAPGLSEMTRAYSLLEYWRTNWLEPIWLGCTVERWLENKSWNDVLAWLDEAPSHKNSDCGLFIQFCMDVGWDKIGSWDANYLSTGTYINEQTYQHPTFIDCSFRYF
jgi:hydrogenase large subunit